MIVDSLPPSSSPLVNLRISIDNSNKDGGQEVSTMMLCITLNFYRFHWLISSIYTTKDLGEKFLEAIFSAMVYCTQRNKHGNMPWQKDTNTNLLLKIHKFHKALQSSLSCTQLNLLQGRISCFLYSSRKYYSTFCFSNVHRYFCIYSNQLEVLLAFHSSQICSIQVFLKTIT